MTEKLKIGHFIPAFNQQVSVNVLSQALRDVTSASRFGHEYHFWSGHSCDLVWLRNYHLDKALNLGLDFLFCQDADTFSECQGGPLVRLLETAVATNATVTTAIVTMRTRPPRANVWPCHPGEVYEADKCGTGMILIDLRRLREWYASYEGPCFARTYDSDKGVTQKIGLDVFFAYVVRDHGGLVVCDGRVPTTHVDATHPHYYDGQHVPGLEDSAEPAANLVSATGA